MRTAIGVRGTAGREVIQATQLVRPVQPLQHHAAAAIQHLQRDRHLAGVRDAERHVPDPQRLVLREGEHQRVAEGERLAGDVLGHVAAAARVADHADIVAVPAQQVPVGDDAVQPTAAAALREGKGVGEALVGAGRGIVQVDVVVSGDVEHARRDHVPAGPSRVAQTVAVGKLVLACRNGAPAPLGIGRRAARDLCPGPQRERSPDPLPREVVVGLVALADCAGAVHAQLECVSAAAHGDGPTVGVGRVAAGRQNRPQIRAFDHPIDPELVLEVAGRRAASGVPAALVPVGRGRVSGQGRRRGYIVPRSVGGRAGDQGQGPACRLERLQVRLAGSGCGQKGCGNEAREYNRAVHGGPPLR
jgi:hypothetical protein